ncbi:MAG: hypothetical protein ACM3KR_06375 [Deltaproteobacteria bacterium]
MKKTYILILLTITIITFTACGIKKTTYNSSQPISNKPEQSQVDNVQPKQPDSKLVKEKEFITKPKDLFSYISLTKDEVIKKLGKKYKIEPTGAEGLEEGFYYPKLGITFAFENKDNKVSSIYCDEKVEINGAKPGMNFKQIQQKLGTAKILESYMETPDNKCYDLRYIIKNISVEFTSMRKDGSDSILRLYPADFRTKLVDYVNTSENNNADTSTNKSKNNNVDKSTNKNLFKSLKDVEAFLTKKNKSNPNFKKINQNTQKVDMNGDGQKEIIFEAKNKDSEIINLSIFSASSNGTYIYCGEINNIETIINYQFFKVKPNKTYLIVIFQGSYLAVYNYMYEVTKDYKINSIWDKAYTASESDSKYNEYEDLTESFEPKSISVYGYPLHIQKPERRYISVWDDDKKQFEEATEEITYDGKSTFKYPQTPEETVINYVQSIGMFDDITKAIVIDENLYKSEKLKEYFSKKMDKFGGSDFEQGIKVLTKADDKATVQVKVKYDPDGACELELVKVNNEWKIQSAVIDEE